MCTSTKQRHSALDSVIPGLDQGSYLNDCTIAGDKERVLQSVIIRFLVPARYDGIVVLCNIVNPSVLFSKSSRRLSIEDATALKEQQNIKLA